MKKKILLLFFLSPFLSQLLPAQTERYYLYDIVTFEDGFDKTPVRVKVDDGRTVERPKGPDGKALQFKTPVAVLLYFSSRGWELCRIGATPPDGDFSGTYFSNSVGNMKNYSGSSDHSAVAYWIFRKPCTLEELCTAAQEGLKTRSSKGREKE